VRRVEAGVVRPGWEAEIEAQGLVYNRTELPGGEVRSYWREGPFYDFTMAEVQRLEGWVAQLFEMCVAAGDHVVEHDLFDRMGIPPIARPEIRRTWEAEPPSVYGRFDLRYDGQGPPKLLEFNADTPTGLVESAVTQWNSLHERLIGAWRDAGKRIGPVLHLAHSEAETSGEEWMTVAYLRDTADQAGLNTVGMTMEQIGFDHDLRRFVDHEGRVMASCFKLYPWEDMIADEFGERVLADPDSTRWIEPLWKVLLSNKALLAALWHLYPGHENLLPAYLDRPWGMRSWIEKPLHGREGDGMRWVIEGTEHASPHQHYGAEGRCYQLWSPPEPFDGAYPVLGAWVVDGHAAGLGVRESDGPVTDYYARFVPHYIDAPTPGQDQRAAWLKEDGVKP